MDVNKDDTERPIAPIKKEELSSPILLFTIIYNFGPVRSCCLTMKAKDTAPSSAAVLRKPKKSKHGKLSTQDVQLENIDQSPEQLKKKKAHVRERLEHDDTSQKKGKKRKKIDAEGQGESKTQSESEEESGPSKKKHKNRTNFVDPREDTQLNTQSRKGVYYRVDLARLDAL